MALLWIPAFAGMTGGWVVRHSGEGRNPRGLCLIIEMLRPIHIAIFLSRWNPGTLSVSDALTHPLTPFFHDSILPYQSPKTCFFHLDISKIQHHRKRDITEMLGRLSNQ
jgi:hypothetical protein